MNNEPIAWIDPNDRLSEPFSWNKTNCHTIPLYTHPAKTLTDEEIDYCWNHSHGNTPWMKQKAFARAILRKAQE
jgi:hypothetical protein